MSAELLQAERPLNATDRCDRCGARAYVRATLRGGLDLLFCAHDWRTHGDAVREVAVAINDETKKLDA